jgi:bifunctional NMN adenylyltransferase/nudix hydrolase
MAQATDVTVYIGRFNPFHNGHAYVLDQALKTSKLVIVLVGSSGGARNTKNPLTFDERHDMIMAWRTTQDSREKRGELVVLPIRDYLYNDALWIRQVQRVVKRAITKFCLQRNTILTNIRLTGSNRDDTTWYLESFPQWPKALVPPYTQDDTNVSATLIRDWMFSTSVNLELAGRMARMVPKSTLHFLDKFSKTQAYDELVYEYEFLKNYRKGWESAPYEPVFVTTDAVVIQSGHILLVERANMPGRGLWALPGGFLKPKDRLRQGAIRELVEETGIRLAEGKKAEELTWQILNGSIRDKEIFDHPERSLRGRTITTAFLFRLDDTKPLPKVKGMNVPAYESGGKEIVETADAFWVPINDALEQTDRWFEDHLSISEWAVNSMDSRSF